MDKFKKQMQQRLIANVISETLAQNEHTIFRDAWCTQERVLRFTTPFFRKLLPSLTFKASGEPATACCSKSTTASILLR